jgi:NADH-quinone oxidoreductase subunit C
MEPVQIAERIREKFPEEVIGTTEFGGQVSVFLKKDFIADICRFLHDSADLAMDYLVDLTAVDWLGRKAPRFEVVYHLYSMEHRHLIRLKAQVSGEDPAIDSVVSIWKGANWHERECYDMFGITFRGHPDPRRILLPEDWEGHPLRKDYPVKGPEAEGDWKGFREVLEKSKTLREFEWERQ